MERPRRALKPPPLTYWEEYVETDPWYRAKMLEDVPPEELWAAVEDDNLEEVGEEGDSDPDSQDEDDTWLQNNLTDEDNASDEDSDEDTDSGEGDSAGEGVSGGEGSDDNSAASPLR